MATWGRWLTNWCEPNSTSDCNRSTSRGRLHFWRYKAAESNAGPVNALQCIVYYLPCAPRQWFLFHADIASRSHGGTNNKSNLYPACNRCNGILYNKVFRSLEEKRAFIKSELVKRGEWHSAEEMQKVRETFPSQETVANILFRRLPMGVVEQKSSKKVYLSRRCSVCGSANQHSQRTQGYCSKKCLEIAWFNLLMVHYLMALAAEFRQDMAAVSDLT